MQNNFLCPICKSEMNETDFYNKIFKINNLYCNNCNSYHIVNEIDTSEYYANEYHKNFKYGNLPKIFQKLGITGNRAIARFVYFKKKINLKKNLTFVEIGGGKGDNFTVLNKSYKPKIYTIIEPNPEYNLNHKNLKYKNEMFENIDSEELRNSHTIFMFHVLEHIFDLDAFFVKLKQISPEYFYFEVPNCENITVKEDSLFNHPHYHHFSKKSLEILAQKHNFQIENSNIIEPVSYHPYKKVGKFKKYFSRISGLHEEINSNGLYLRMIFKLK
jgi:hypothetical protein